MNAPAGSSPRPDLSSLLQDIAALDVVIDGWGEQEQRVVAAMRHAVEALHGEALRRMIMVIKQSAEAQQALRGAAEDEVVYAVLRRHGLLRASLQERIEGALQHVRPMLEAHGGDVELVEVSPPDSVTVRMLGACNGCPASLITLHDGIERAIRDACPEIQHIHRAVGNAPAHVDVVHIVSPFERDRPWQDVCEETLLAGRRLHAVMAGELRVLLACTGQGLRAYENACAHLGLELDTGTLQDDRLTCPHHGFEYELTEGQCLTVPELCLRRIPVRVQDNRVQVQLP